MGFAERGNEKDRQLGMGMGFAVRTEWEWQNTEWGSLPLTVLIGSRDVEQGCRRFETGGVPGPTSENVAACPSPDGSARDGARRGEGKAAGAREGGGNPAAFVFFSRPGRMRLQ
jgi:hypothetical protein